MLHECDGSHLQFVFWQALVRFAHSAPAQQASACGGGRDKSKKSVKLIRPVQKLIPLELAATESVKKEDTGEKPQIRTVLD